MSVLYSYILKGDFFSNSLIGKNLNEDIGFEVYKVRMPNIQDNTNEVTTLVDIRLPISFDSFLLDNLQNNYQDSSGDENVFNYLQNQLNEGNKLKLTIIEANFSYWKLSSIDASEEKYIDINLISDWFQKLDVPSSIELDSFLDSFRYGPILPMSDEVAILNTNAFESMLSKFKNIWQKSDKIVFTGEMVWAGWVRMLDISRKLNIGEQRMIWDDLGIIHLLSRGKVDKHHRDLLIGRLLSNQNKKNLVVNNVSTKGTLRSLSPSIFSVRRDTIRLDLPAECILSKDIGEMVEFGEVIGRQKKVKRILQKLDVRKKDLEKHLAVVEGQFVEKGDNLIDISILRGFLQKKIVAKESGKVSLKFLEDSYIVIDQLQSSSDFISQMNGIIKSIKPNRYIYVETDCIEIPLDLKIGRSVSGSLVTFDELQIGNDNILFLKSIDNLPQDLSLEFITKYNIKGIVIGCSDKKLIRDIQSKYKQLWQNISLGVIVDNSDTSFVTQKLMALHGCYVVIDSKSLIVCIKDESTKAWIDTLGVSKEDRNIQKSQLAKHLSYDNKHGYVRIEKVFSDGSVLVSNGKELFLSHPQNLIIYRSF